MDNGKKKGIALIIIGICFPLFALPFVSGFDINKGFMDNFYNTGIRITKNNANSTPDTNKPSVEASKPSLNPLKMRIDKIPFRFFFVPTIFLIYVAIVMIDRARKH